MSRASCSTHAGRGNICGCSRWEVATGMPASLKMMHLVLVVPWSIAAMKRPAMIERLSCIVEIRGPPSDSSQWQARVREGRPLPAGTGVRTLESACGTLEVGDSTTGTAVQCSQRVRPTGTVTIPLSLRALQIPAWHAGRRDSFVVLESRARRTLSHHSVLSLNRVSTAATAATRRGRRRMPLAIGSL